MSWIDDNYLNLKDKKIIVVGGGNEAEKRIKAILNEKCEIIVISDFVNAGISKLVKIKQIKLKKQKIENMKFIFRVKTRFNYCKYKRQKN